MELRGIILFLLAVAFVSGLVAQSESGRDIGKAIEYDRYEESISIYQCTQDLPTLPLYDNLIRAKERREKEAFCTQKEVFYKRLIVALTACTEEWRKECLDVGFMRRGIAYKRYDRLSKEDFEQTAQWLRDVGFHAHLFDHGPKYQEEQCPISYLAEDSRFMEFILHWHEPTIFERVIGELKTLTASDDFCPLPFIDPDDDFSSPIDCSVVSEPDFISDYEPLVPCDEIRRVWISSYCGLRNVAESGDRFRFLQDDDDYNYITNYNIQEFKDLFDRRGYHMIDYYSNPRFIGSGSNNIISHSAIVSGCCNCIGVHCDHSHGQNDDPWMKYAVITTEADSFASHIISGQATTITAGNNNDFERIAVATAIISGSDNTLRTDNSFVGSSSGNELISNNDDAFIPISSTFNFTISDSDLEFINQ